MLPPEGDLELADLVFDLLKDSAGVAASLAPPVKREIGRLVRSMNCYYSNLIEDHYTHPKDIERALHGDLQIDPRKRDLQLEAKAHIELQALIDNGHDPNIWPCSQGYAKWLHHEFCSRLPEDLLWATDSASNKRSRVIPGAYRSDDVEVGRHIPPSATAVPTFMTRFDEAYAPNKLSKVQQVVSAAASHHRLLWIHPFLDGNGRVARLMSYSILMRLDIGSSIWSIARGLSRRVDEYKRALARADMERRNDLDGRGTLSLETLRDFCRFFLSTCKDQIAFMKGLLEPEEILRRIEIYVSEEVAAKRLPKGSYEMLREAFYSGEVPRGRAPSITGYEERRARETVSVLLEKGLLSSPSHRSPLSLGFPHAVLDRWLPNLFVSDRHRDNT